MYASGFDILALLNLSFFVRSIIWGMCLCQSASI